MIVYCPPSILGWEEPNGIASTLSMPPHLVRQLENMAGALSRNDSLVDQVTGGGGLAGV
jgi:hypothetical protein